MKGKGRDVDQSLLALASAGIRARLLSRAVRAILQIGLHATPSQLAWAIKQGCVARPPHRRQCRTEAHDSAVSFDSLHAQVEASAPQVLGLSRVALYPVGEPLGASRSADI